MSYGDGGFFFLQPVNNGYGGIEVAPSYGRSTEPMQQPGFFSSDVNIPGVTGSQSGGFFPSAVRKLGPGVMPSNVAENLVNVNVAQAQQDLKMALDKAYTAFKIAMGHEEVAFALLAALPQDQSGYNARSEQLAELVKLRQNAFALVTEIRQMQANLGAMTGNSPPPMEYPEFAPFPAEEMQQDMIDEEMMVPDEEPPLSAPPAVGEPDFYAKNETAIMLVAGAVGAYALLRMLK